MLSLIARIVENKSTIGYRLIDSNSNQTKDVSKEALEKVTKSGITIEGAGIKNNKLAATNGSFERYSSINSKGTLLGKPSLVVLFRVDGGFICCDYKGKVGRYREKDVVAYSKSNGIANGKVVNNNGSEYISSIIGEYNVLEESTKQLEKKVDKVIETTVIEKKNDNVANYRTKEHMISEIICKNGMTKSSDLSYKAFVKIMDTNFAEEKDIDWFKSEVDTGLMKLKITILSGGYDFIILYKSLRVIKAKKMGLKLGECLVSVVYRGGLASRCYAHAESLETIISNVSEFYIDYDWTAYEMSMCDNYWGGRTVPDRLIAVVDGANSGFWYVPTSKKQLVNGLEIVINRLDGCCYLALSEYEHAPKVNTRDTRAFQLVLKFKNLDYGMKYYKELLNSKFRESIERIDMFKVADRATIYRLNDGEYTGPYTYLIYCYRNRLPINEEIYMRYYGKTTADFGIVHPDECSTIIKTVRSTDKYIQPVYKITNYCYICKNTRTGAYVTHNVGYLDGLRVKNQLMEYKEEALSNIISEEQINRLNKTNYDAKQRAIMIGLEVEGGDSIEMFNTRKTSIQQHVMEYIKINSITLFGISVTPDNTIIMDGECIKTNGVKARLNVFYLDIYKGRVWGGYKQRYNYEVQIKSINRVWEQVR